MKFPRKNARTCQILNQNPLKRQVLKWKILQRVRFWLKNLQFVRISIEKKYDAVDFELNFFRHVSFWKYVRVQKNTFWFILLRENDITRNFRAFLKSILWVENSITCQILNWEK